jgi:hypothetical protein
MLLPIRGASLYASGLQDQLPSVNKPFEQAEPPMARLSVMQMLRIFLCSRSAFQLVSASLAFS